MAKKIHQSILESVKEHLQCRQKHAQLLEQWDSASALRSGPTLEYQPGAHALYKLIKPDSYEKALVVAQDVHCQALVAAHLLEDHIEWLSQQVSYRSCSHGQSCSCRQSHSHRWSHSHQHPHSCRCSKSHEVAINNRSLQWWSTGGTLCKDKHHHLAPPQPRRQVTFEKSSPMRDTKVKQFLPSTSGDRLSWEANDSWPLSWAEGPEDLGCPPELDLQVQEFLSRAGAPYAGNNDDSDWSSTLELPFDDNNRWVMWHAHQVETPAWWPKLQKVPK